MCVYIYTYIHTYITLHDMTWHDMTWHYITYIHTYIYLVCVLMMHVFLCPLNSMCVYIYIYSHCPALGVYLGTSIGGRNASSLPRGVPGMSKMFAVSKLWAMERQPFVHTWWLIPVSKWIITPVISGIYRVNPLFFWGELTHLRAVGWATKYTVY